jgi:hypothetical protein
MAETPVEIVIRARNEAQAALNQAVGQLKQLELSTKAAATTGAQLRGLRDAISQISPAAGQAITQVQGLAGAGAAFGTAAVAAGAAAAGIGLIGAAAIAASKSLADTVEQLDNLSAVTGTSIGDIQVLSELFERQGLGADVARTALHKLNVAIGEGHPLLKELGVTARDPLEALLQLSDAFATSADTGARAKVAQELLGKSSKDLLAVVDRLRGSFPQLNREMDATGQRMGTDLLEKGRRLDTMFETFGGRVEGLGNKLKGLAATAVETAIRLTPLLALAFRPPRVDPWQTLRQGAHEYQGATDRVREALDAYNKTHEKASSAVQQHAARVKELVDLFGLQKKAAEGIVSAQEDLERFRRKEALSKELFEPKTIGGVEVKADRIKPSGIPGILPGPEARAQILADWRSFIDEISSSAQVLNETINSLGSGLTSGLTQVFQGLLTQGQTFGSAIVGIFTSMINALLAQLARLIAFKFLGLLIGSALPTGALAGALNFNESLFPLRKTFGTGAGEARPGSAIAADQRTFIIQTLDARDVVANLSHPGGSLRRSQDRVIAAGAY